MGRPPSFIGPVLTQWTSWSVAHVDTSTPFKDYENNGFLCYVEEATPPRWYNENVFHTANGMCVVFYLLNLWWNDGVSGSVCLSQVTEEVTRQ